MMVLVLTAFFSVVELAFMGVLVLVLVLTVLAVGLGLGGLLVVVLVVTSFLVVVLEKVIPSGRATVCLCMCIFVRGLIIK